MKFEVRLSIRKFIIWFVNITWRKEYVHLGFLYCGGLASSPKQGSGLFTIGWNTRHSTIFPPRTLEGLMLVGVRLYQRCK